jgi:D-alanyl-D-alanine carboxypeptidase
MIGKGVSTLGKTIIILVLVVAAILIVTDNLVSRSVIFMGKEMENDNDWMLMLVNRDKLLSAGYKPPLESLPNGLLFDRRAIGHLNAMISAAQAQGLSPVICSAYRTIEYQQTLFDKQIQKQMARGLNRNQAEIEAARNVAYPGTSEHHLGLAVDIVSLQYQQLDEAQARTPEIIWLTEHCSEYGFILRYPKDKTQITGIVYEPWHFRYVGVETAKVIMEQGLCLEEYLELMRK